MSVKKVLLKKKVSSTVFDIYTKTSSDIVVFTPAGADPIDTTVEAAIRALQGLVGTTSVASQISSAIADLVDSAPATFDTLKEIADWIAGAGEGAYNAVAKITALETLTGAWTVPASGEDPEVPATGMCARIEAIEASISSMGADKAAVVVISGTDFDGLSEVSATDLYMVELA
jgi:prophage DNA circulation protein